MTARVTRALVLAGLLSAVPEAAHAETRLKVLVPDGDNLQYMTFWVAKARGYFADEGIGLDLVVPPGPQQAAGVFERREAEAAVLPAPMYLTLIADKAPVVVVASLLRHDPIDLIVKRSVVNDRAIEPAMPLRERLTRLKGLRIGVAPHPPARLRMLFASEGLDADKDVTIVVLHGKEQNAAFHAGTVDALYAHTPYLERAIENDGAVVVVHQAGGEVKALADRPIHGFAFQRGYLEAHPDTVDAAVRAIARAQTSIHASQTETVDALAREFPSRPRAELVTIVRLYEPAIPERPDVRAEELLLGLPTHPTGMPKPNLTGIDLARHVLPAAVTPSGPRVTGEQLRREENARVERNWRWLLAATALAALAAVALVFQAWRARPQK